MPFTSPYEPVNITACPGPVLVRAWPREAFTNEAPEARSRSNPPVPKAGAEAFEEVLPALVHGDQDDEAGVLLCRGRACGDCEKKAGDVSSEHVQVLGCTRKWSTNIRILRGRGNPPPCSP